MKILDQWFYLKYQWLVKHFFFTFSFHPIIQLLRLINCEKNIIQKLNTTGKPVLILKKNDFSLYNSNRLCIDLLSLQDFLEPFECERQREQQHRAFRQIQSHMSFELDGGYLLGSMSRPSHDEKDFRNQIIHLRDDELTWPIRMVRERRLARKSGYFTKNLGTDLLLDMPNLSNDWGRCILSVCV